MVDPHREAEADRDALLGALGFKPGPLGAAARRKMILGEAAGRLSAMIKAREEARRMEGDAMLWWLSTAEGRHNDKPLLLTVWRQRKVAEKALAGRDRELGETRRQRDAALAEVERLRAEMAIAAPGDLLGSEWGRSTFARLFGETYQPVLWGKHHATHPTVLEHALRIAGQRAPELCDVIAALVWQSGIVGNRARFACDEVSAQRAQADRLNAVLRSLEWTGTTDRDDGGDEACCPRCAQPKRLGDHAPECTVAAALTAGGQDGR